jgi:uncharacterized membrane protein YgdD (TMEM256/DUF423 family)
MIHPQTHLVIACLFGAAGVALWAYATHAVGPGSATIAAQMLLIHAGAIIALVAVRGQGLVPQRLSGWLTTVLALGVALFSVDLALRGVSGTRLFPMASPLGGVLMIGAWLGLAVSAVFRPRS